MIKVSLILATLCCISCFSNKLEELDQKYASGSGSGLDYYDYSGYGSIDYYDYSGSGSGFEVERALPKKCKNAKNPERCRRKKKKLKENGEEDGEEARIASGSGSSDYYDYSGYGSMDYYDYSGYGSINYYDYSGYDYYGSGSMDYYGDYYDYYGDYYDYYGSGMDYYGDNYDYSGSGSGSALKERALQRNVRMPRIQNVVDARRRSKRRME